MAGFIWVELGGEWWGSGCLGVKWVVKEVGVEWVEGLDVHV